MKIYCLLFAVSKSIVFDILTCETASLCGMLSLAIKREDVKRDIFYYIFFNFLQTCIENKQKLV